jgi:DNA (cytosine-5)-methyltransferase 1
MTKVVSLFSGAGGLDLGFVNAGFDVVWANEHDKTIWETYSKNHPNCKLDTRSITKIHSDEIPDCDGIIGGPPCQSWSDGGSRKGINDKRGQLFFEFVRILKEKQPKFFVAENVQGILSDRNKPVVDTLTQLLKGCGYNLHIQLFDLSEYGVPQDRKRVIFLGIRDDLDISYSFPLPNLTSNPTLSNAIGDLQTYEVKSCDRKSKSTDCEFPNHEFMEGDYSAFWLMRNRVRNWEQRSYTIVASARHMPLHPQAPKMIKTPDGPFIFESGKEHLYRRLSVRECARIQTFPDDFKLIYNKIEDGYKMIGNAVPPKFAYRLAKSIKGSLNNENSSSDLSLLR